MEDEVFELMKIIGFKETTFNSPYRKFIYKDTEILYSPTTLRYFII